MTAPFYPTALLETEHATRALLEIHAHERRITQLAGSDLRAWHERHAACSTASLIAMLEGLAADIRKAEIEAQRAERSGR